LTIRKGSEKKKFKVPRVPRVPRVKKPDMDLILFHRMVSTSIHRNTPRLGGKGGKGSGNLNDLYYTKNSNI
jgi:hypothetical protein